MKHSADLSQEKFQEVLLQRVPAKVAWDYCVMPVAQSGGGLKMLAAEAMRREKKEELRVILGCPLEFESRDRVEIIGLIEKTYGVGAEVIESLTGETKETAALDFEAIDQVPNEDATVIRLVNEILKDAIRCGASDIHIEPFENQLQIRYRVDGILCQAKVSERIRQIAPNLVSRIKIMAKMDIAEKRLPQDGRIKIKSTTGELDLRVSILPSSFGEAIVIRILKSLALLSLEELGFFEDALSVIRRNLKKPYGMILITGPTGSGKTTTLYACLKELNTRERKIITIEDPVEYKLRGILQMQIHEKIDFTFAKALRSMLRHDPDCLMVGEIRDLETAEIAIRSALTGHLVFSTLHTNDAASAITRLIEMGIEPYLVASSVEAILAQRLVRRLDSQGNLHGRTVVYEFMTMSERLRELTVERQPASVLQKQALTEGMVPMIACGRRKIQQGLTTEDEIRRVLA